MDEKEPQLDRKEGGQEETVYDKKIEATIGYPTSAMGVEKKGSGIQTLQDGSTILFLHINKESFSPTFKETNPDLISNQLRNSGGAEVRLKKSRLGVPEEGILAEEAEVSSAGAGSDRIIVTVSTNTNNLKQKIESIFGKNSEIDNSINSQTVSVVFKGPKLKPNQ